MSAPAAAGRQPGRYFDSNVHSVIENMAFLSNAELRLALIVLRLTEKNPTAAVSQELWEKWAGLEDRSRELAIADLGGKGALKVHGRGVSAKFAFSAPDWRHYVRHADRDEKPRSKGRARWARNAAAKAKAKVSSIAPRRLAAFRCAPLEEEVEVHAECEERGCALSRKGPSALIPPAIAQPVAHVPSGDGWSIPADEPATLFVAMPIAQPVAQTKETPPQARKGVASAKGAQGAAPGEGCSQEEKEALQSTWAKTLVELRRAFATVGVDFLKLLIAAVAVVLRNVTDEELSEAVMVAWRAKSSKQKGEGMFLTTVPAVLETLRTQRKPPPDPQPQPPARKFNADPENHRGMWATIRRAVKGKITPDAYANWMLQTKFHSFVRDELTVAVVDEVTADFLALEYREFIAAAAAELFPNVKTVAFIVEESSREEVERGRG